MLSNSIRDCLKGVGFFNGKAGMVGIDCPI